MRCVAPNNPHPDWALCYNLLLKANAGYCIQLSNTLALNPTFNGWPALQVSLILCLLFVNPYSDLAPTLSNKKSMRAQQTKSHVKAGFEPFYNLIKVVFVLVIDINLANCICS